MKKIFVFAFATLGASVFAQTTFSQGDVAIVGYNSSNPAPPTMKPSVFRTEH